MTRKEFLTTSFGWIAVVGVSRLSAATLTQNERDRAMSALHASRKQFLDVVTGVSAAQWTFQPGPARWSVAQVAEHITVAEAGIFGVVQTMLQAPAAPEKRAGIKVTDDRILESVPDRTSRFQAPENLVPTGRFTTREELILAFKTRRDKTIEFAEKTTDDLRNHVMNHPALGPLDAYQWMLFISAHSERHVNQMKEVIADPKFPKA